MKRLAVAVLACLWVLVALPSAFAGEAKAKGPEAKPAPAKPAAKAAADRKSVV